MIHTEGNAGTEISNAIRTAIKRANDEDETVSFYFNGAGVIVPPGSDASLIGWQWDTEMRLIRLEAKQ